MNRWIIPPVTLAAVFVTLYYPDEHKVSARHHAPAPAQLPDAYVPPQLPKAYQPAPRLSLSAALPKIAFAAAEVKDERPAMDAKEAASRWRKIEALMKCAKDEACKLPDTDSRARSFAVRDGLLEQGQWFLEHKPVGAEQEQKAFKAAALLVSFPDEAVQGQGLEWLLSMPVRPESVGLLKKELSLMVDPELVRLSFLELKRHLGTEQEEAALALVGQVLLQGGIFASREAARLAPTLVHEGNEERFRAWLAELPPDSAKARILREGLNAVRGGA